MVTFGTATAAPGEKDTGRLEVGETRDGSTFGLPVASSTVSTTDGHSTYRRPVTATN